MKLADSVIIREERDCYLLYNGENGGLVSVSKQAYRDVILLDKTGDPEYVPLCAWLLNAGFLPQKPDQRMRSGAHSGARINKPSSYGLFELKSDLNPLNVLWALTPNCNLRCVYCFPDARAHSSTFNGLPMEALLKIADEIIDSEVLQVILSGGECLLMKGIWTIVRKLKDAGLTVAIISNGTTISGQTLLSFRDHGALAGISLDGPTEEINSLTRGRGVFDQAVRAIRRLIKSDVDTSVLVTLTTHNFPVLDSLFALLDDLGVVSVTLQDLRPFGTKQVYDSIRLTAQQERELLGAYRRIAAANPRISIAPTELFLYFMSDSSSRIMQCPAGDNFAYIDFYGDVYPCNSLPSFRLGSLLDGTTLADLWTGSKKIEELRRLKQMPVESIPGCASCSNLRHCEGGCRGDALFYDDDLFGLPSRCPQRLGILGS